MGTRLNSIETKIRINEQNLLNDRQHSQLINKNLLDLKKEIRERLDAVSHETKELKIQVEELSGKVDVVGKQVKARVVRKAAPPKPVNLAKPQMSSNEASKILDNILKGKAPIKK